MSVGATHVDCKLGEAEEMTTTGLYDASGEEKPGAILCGGPGSIAG
jgi:hypothetical protein